MADSGFLALTDDKLAEAYNYVAPDYTKLRATFLRGLAKAEAAFNEGKQHGGAASQWSANNNVVKFTPKLVNKPVVIGGKSEHLIPAERFPHALAELRKEVEAGKHDETLASVEKEAIDLSNLNLTSHRLSQRAGSVRAGWSDERRARFNATQAAKKAAKASK